MVDCAVFVYRHKFCCHGELFMGNNGYEIIYDPEESSQRSSTDESSGIQSPFFSPQQPDGTPLRGHTTSPSPSRLMLSFIGHLSPTTPDGKPRRKKLHRILIDWDTISGLQRINKDIKYDVASNTNTNPSPLQSKDSKHATHHAQDALPQMETKHANTSPSPSPLTTPTATDLEGEEKREISLSEQLIIESKTYPKLQILEYNELLRRYDVLSTDPIRTHYIGLEYDLSDAHQVLLGSNYDEIHKYHIAGTEIPELDLNFNGILNLDLDSNINAIASSTKSCKEYKDLHCASLLESHPSYALLLNHSLPAWIWVPLLNHSMRILIEKVILLGNISLFLWTIYQMTKYTSIIQTFYELVVFPLFEYISQPLIKKWYYFLNLMRFNVVVQLWSSLFAAFYNFIPIHELYRVFSFIDQHIVQQMLSLFTMFYRLLLGFGNVLWPCCGVVLRCCGRCLSLIELDCLCCKRMSALCCDGQCWRTLQFGWQCLMRCCRFCQRSQSLTDSSTKLLKAGVAAEELNAVNADSAWMICNGIREICGYFKSIVDVFWLSIGKPIKHSYDFFRYVRSEVGTVVAFCIRKCCRKGKEKVKIAGQRVLEEAKTKIKERMPSIDTITAKIEDTNKPEMKEVATNSLAPRDGQKIRLNLTMESKGLRHRAKGKGTRSFAEEEHDGDRKHEEEQKEPMYSAVRGIPYFKDQDI